MNFAIHVFVTQCQPAVTHGGVPHTSSITKTTRLVFPEGTPSCQRENPNLSREGHRAAGPCRTLEEAAGLVRVGGKGGGGWVAGGFAGLVVCRRRSPSGGLLTAPGSRLVRGGAVPPGSGQQGPEAPGVHNTEKRRCNWLKGKPQA